MPTDTERLDCLARLVRHYSQKSKPKERPKRDGWLHLWDTDGGGVGVAACFFSEPYPAKLEEIEGRGTTLREALDAILAQEPSR